VCRYNWHSAGWFPDKLATSSAEQQQQQQQHTFNGPLSGTTQVSRYQKSETNLDFIGARGNEWQWHQLGHMQICTSLRTNNHAITPPLSFLQARCPSCRPTNSVKALKASSAEIQIYISNKTYRNSVIKQHLETVTV